MPLDEPESDGTFTWRDTTLVVVEAAAGGERGLGFSYATAACAPLVRDVLAEQVVGRDALDPPGAWGAMVRSVRNIGRPGVASCAIAAVDTALWDLKAKLLGLPLCRVLGMAHDRVPLYGSGGFTSMTDAALREQLAGWVHADGIPRVKMKIGAGWGTDPRRDLERIAVARTAIGPDADLFVDANGAYTRKQAVRIAHRFEHDHAVSWFEEPVSSDDLHGLHEIRGMVGSDVAAGEYGYDLAYFERMCAAGAVDVLQADVTRCAGITEWLRAAAVAAAHGLDVSSHCAPALHLHPALSVANFRHAEWFADHDTIEHRLFEGAPAPRDGAMAPDLGRPGCGLELKRADAEVFRKEV